MPIHTLRLEVALPLAGIAAQLLVAAVREKARSIQRASPAPSQTWHSHRASTPVVAGRH